MLRRSTTRAVHSIAGVLVLGMAASATALPLASAHAPAVETSDRVPVAATTERKRVARHPAYVESWRTGRSLGPGDCPGLHSWNPANPDRGYCDPGFAYHGNAGECAIDEGYGRWSSCYGLR